MKILTYIGIVLLTAVVLPAGAQIRFFEGSYAEALAKAKKEKKDLFVDCWAEWCAPCKMLAETVFTDGELGDYFNDRFVCVKLNVEKPENKEVVKRYQIASLPTLLFISRDDKELRRVAGAQPAPGLLREARIALGEELSYEQVYAKYRKNKKDHEALQQLLIEGPEFLMKQEGYNREKWNARIESFFPEYLKSKKLERMINDVDFYILTLYHPQRTKEDPVFDFVVANYGKFVSAIDTATVARYVIGLNNSYIIQLCKQGNPAYRESIKRVSGDLQPIYNTFSFGALSVEEAITLLADATFHLYRRNVAGFFENMDRYFAAKGADVELNDYTQPLQDLAVAYEGQLPQEAYPRCIPWIGKALEFKEETTPEIRTRLLTMLGQCFQNTEQAGKAKQCYNQAFIESAQIKNPAMRQDMQQMIQGILQSLEP